MQFPHKETYRELTFFTLSKVSAGTRKPFMSRPGNTTRNAAKFGAVRCFTFENCPTMHSGISSAMRIKNNANSSLAAAPTRSLYFSLTAFPEATPGLFSPVPVLALVVPASAYGGLM